MKAADDPALTAYEAFASIYNDFNASNDYEMWLGRVLLPELGKHGLREDGGRALDVGCGTGRAFGPLLRRGWRVSGCDLSPAMLNVAAEAGGEVELQVADMRELPRIGGFDLVLSLNDSVNYLLGDDDLVLALAGMRANLADEGLLIFDVNSRSTYESWVSDNREVEHQGSRWVWTARGEVAPSIFEAEIAGDRLVEPIRHLERFRPEHEVREAMRAAGLHTVAVFGMSEANGEVLLGAPDEDHNYKLVYIGAASR